MGDRAVIGNDPDNTPEEQYLAEATTEGLDVPELDVSVAHVENLVLVELQDAVFNAEDAEES